MTGVRMKNIGKRIVDAAMTVLLLFLMAFQVTGEMAHEWIGIGMTVLVIVHQILNRKWYGAGLFCPQDASIGESGCVKLRMPV